MTPRDLGYKWISDRNSLTTALRNVAESMADIAVGSSKDPDDVDAPVEFITHPERAGDFSALMGLAGQIGRQDTLTQGHINTLARVLETTDFGDDHSRNILQEMVQRSAQYIVSKALYKSAVLSDGPAVP